MTARAFEGLAHVAPQADADPDGASGGRSRGSDESADFVFRACAIVRLQRRVGKIMSGDREAVRS
jgi:hypothetical protein